MVSTNFLTQNMLGNNFLNGGYLNSFSGFGSYNNMFGSVFNYGGYSNDYQGAVIGNTIANFLVMGVTACFSGKVGGKSSGTSTESGQVENDSNLSVKEQLDNVEKEIKDELSNIGVGVNESNYNNYDITKEENYKNLQNDLNTKTKAVTDLTKNGENLEAELNNMQDIMKAYKAQNTAGNLSEAIKKLEIKIAEKEVAIENNKNDLKKAKEAQAQAKKDLDEYIDNRTDKVKTVQKNIKKLIQKRNTLKIKVENEDNDATLKDLRKTAAEFVKAKNTNPQNKAKIRHLAQQLANLNVNGLNTLKGDDKYLQVRESAKKWLEENPNA